MDAKEAVIAAVLFVQQPLRLMQMRDVDHYQSPPLLD